MSVRSVKHHISDWLMVLIGSLCMGVAVSLFNVPNEIAPGGVTGIATILHHLTGIPVGTGIAMINLPLLFSAWRWIGRNFTRRSLVGILMTSTAIDLTAALPAFHADRLLAALFGGVLMGTGLGLILSRGASTGGSEIIARLLEKRWPHIPIGKLILLVDGVVISLAAIVYRRVDSMLYAAISVYITSVLADRLVYGGRRGKAVLLFSRRYEELAKRIMEDLGRGVTMLRATGGYSGKDSRVLLCAVSRTELYSLKRLVLEIDDQAFFMMLSADEVLGTGWLSLDNN